MSPTLFNLYTDLEEELAKGPGRIMIGNERITTIEYADDVVLMADKEESLRAMLRSLEKYLNGKKLQLNVEESKVMIFKKGGRKEKGKEWWWKGKRLEEVKEFKYLGYVL